MTEFGRRLRAAREEAGLSLEDLGARCGIARQHVSRYELGLHEPSASRLRALCLALQASADDLLGLA